MLTLERANIEYGSDVFGREWLWGKKQQRMNLSHGTANAPTRTHLSPVKDVLALDGGQSRHISFISVQTEYTEL